MQTLKLADDLMPLARDGLKRVTIRSGKRDIVPGELTFEATNGTEPDIRVNVLRVISCALIVTPAWTLDGEDLIDHYDLMQVLQRFYPDIQEDSIITAIEFEAV